jgi:diguanylate cyclase (GGDEF)-like protein/PAS domain S-box-containing protein
MNEAADGLWHLNGYQPARIPDNDAARVAALRGLGLLDSAPTEAFDQVARLAAKALGVPIVLITLVDEHRQWFKSRVGVEITQTPRAVSFCAHVMVTLRPLIVRDTTRDARFAANPTVMNAPYVRSYAGIPLFTADGHAIGTLCAIDQKAREFDEREMKILADAAAIIQGFITTHELAVSRATLAAQARDGETFFRDTFEKAAVGIIHSSPTGELLRVNQRLCEMLGYTAFELRRLSYLDISHPDDIDTTSDLLQNVSSGSFDGYSIEKRYLRKDGTYLWTFVSVALRRTPAGSPDYFIAMIEDITSRKQFERELITSRDQLSKEVAQQAQKLHDSNVALRTHVKKLLESERRVQQTEHRLRAIANCMPILLGYWNRDLICELANEPYRQLFGIPPERIIGMSMSDLMGSERFAEIESHTRRALAGASQLFERSEKRMDGVQAHLEIRYEPDKNDLGHVDGFFVLVTDVTGSRNVQLALESANARLSNSDETDYLTGIANHTHFKARVLEARRDFVEKGETYGIIVMDIDDLKRINDSHGHEASDEILRSVGLLLKGQLRNHRDVVARLGGGEFAVLCFGDLDEELLSLGAQALREKISLEMHPGRVRITASFGVALSCPHPDHADVHARAEDALAAAKEAGKNRVSVRRCV